jgi:hypothetical protein
MIPRGAAEFIHGQY